MSNWTISINILCVKCGQRVTQPEVDQNNYQLIILPALTFQHQVCPRSQPNPERCFFENPPNDIPENTININLK